MNLWQKYGIGIRYKITHMVIFITIFVRCDTAVTLPDNPQAAVRSFSTDTGVAGIANVTVTPLRSEVNVKTLSGSITVSAVGTVEFREYSTMNYRWGTMDKNAPLSQVYNQCTQFDGAVRWEVLASWRFVSISVQDGDQIRTNKNASFEVLVGITRPGEIEALIYFVEIGDDNPYSISFPKSTVIYEERVRNRAPETWTVPFSGTEWYQSLVSSFNCGSPGNWFYSPDGFAYPIGLQQNVSSSNDTVITQPISAVIDPIENTVRVTTAEYRLTISLFGPVLFRSSSEVRAYYSQDENQLIRAIFRQCSNREFVPGEIVKYLVVTWKDVYYNVKTASKLPSSFQMILAFSRSSIDIIVQYKSINYNSAEPFPKAYHTVTFRGQQPLLYFYPGSETSSFDDLLSNTTCDSPGKYYFSLVPGAVQSTPTVPNITVAPTATWYPWSSWTSCVFNHIVDQYIQERQRGCSVPRLCSGDNKEVLYCKTSETSPMTVAPIGKVNGSFYVQNLRINNSTVDAGDLETILLARSIVYKKLQRVSYTAVLNYYRRWVRYTVNDSVINELSVGSLVIGYTIEVVTGGEEITVDDIEGQLKNASDTTFFDGEDGIEGDIDPEQVYIIDYDECKLDANPCHADAVCLNFNDKISYGCQCKDGFKGSGFDCTVDDGNDDEDGGSHSTLIIICSCAAGVLFLVVLCIIIYCCYHVRHGRPDYQPKNDNRQEFVHDVYTGRMDTQTPKRVEGDTSSRYQSYYRREQPPYDPVLSPQPRYENNNPSRYQPRHYENTLFPAEDPHKYISTPTSHLRENGADYAVPPLRMAALNHMRQGRYNSELRTSAPWYENQGFVS